jgi:hypothetical protein
MEILNTRLSPAMVECLPEWYPGWRALHRLKEEWVAKDRSKNGVHIAESLTDDSRLASDTDTCDAEDLAPALICQ